MDDPHPPAAAGLLRLTDGYHRAVLLCGGVLLPLAWSRVISIASRAHFSRALLLLAALSGTFVAIAHLRGAGRSRLALAWLALCVYFWALTLWNQRYFEHILASGYSGDIFRNALRTFQAPLYGVAATLTAAKFAAIVIFAAGYALVLHRALRPAARPRRVVLAFMALQLLAIVGCAGLNGDGAWPGAQVIHGGFETAQEAFSSAGQMWSGWNQRMAQFHARASHYPPGPALIALLETRHGLPGLWMSVSVLSVLLCLPLLEVLGADLGLAPPARASACAWLVAGAAFMSLAPVANAAPTAFLALAALAALGRALRGGRGHAVLSGLLLGLYALYSFTVVFVFLLALLWLLFSATNGAVSRARAAQCAARLLLASAGVGLAVDALTGFNLVTCFANAVGNNRDAMSHELFEVPVRYALRSSGNLLAYAACLGPLCALYALRGAALARRAGPACAAFVWASLAAVLLAGVSGCFFLETERVWMFFTPALAIAAAVGLGAATADGAAVRQHALVLVSGALLGATLALAMGQDMPPDEQVSAAAWQRARALLHPDAPVPARATP